MDLGGSLLWTVDPGGSGWILVDPVVESWWIPFVDPGGSPLWSLGDPVVDHGGSLLWILADPHCGSCWIPIVDTGGSLLWIRVDPGESWWIPMVDPT